MPRIILPVPIEEKPPIYQRIAWWFENTLIRSFKGFFNDSFTSIKDVVSIAITDAIEDMERSLIELIRPFANQILALPELPSYIRSPIEEAMTGKEQAGITVLIGLAGGLIGAITAGFVGPIGRLVQMQTERIFRSRLLDPGTLTTLRVRNIIPNDLYRRLMAANGISEDAIDALDTLARPLFSSGELAQLKWRDRLTPAAVNAELAHYGYNPTQQAFLQELMTVIPSPTELVSMAVREAFNDQTAARFGYDEDYPAEAAEWALKGGMQPIWFKRFWRAHWNLPGLVQVREMYNRGIIDDGELNIYLRAADIPSFWRTSITKWFKAEVTRVDVRRIFSLGLLSPEQVFERYLRLGYTEDDAGLMTQWTAAQYLEDDRELTKADILSMYEDGILNENEATTYLSALDYRQEAILLLLAQRDLKRQASYEKQIIANVKKLFVAGIYSRTDVFSELGKIDTPASFIEQSLAVWDLDIKAKVSIPTTAQLRDMTLAGIMPIDRFRLEMGKKGYTTEYVEWYVQLWLIGE